MRDFDVQAVELEASFDVAFRYIADPRTLPEWTHAFRSVEVGRATLATARGALDIRLEVSASRESGTVDWTMTFPDGSVGRAFSRLVGFMAPYTGTIGARVLALSDGHCEVELADRPWVQNHLRSIHAVALVNLAELCGNVALAYSLPDDARFIVAGLSIDYVKKARGTIRAVSDCPVPETSARREYDVPVRMLDASGAEVARCVLRSLVGPKSGRGAA